MNIYIKSFNRPYYLERCVRSIYRNVSGFQEIIILDDGTPEKFLSKLIATFPKLIVRKSEFYESKSQMIETEAIDRNKMTFPGSFWYRELRMDRQEKFMLLEDDMHIIKPIILDEISTFMSRHKISLFKFFWCGSPQLIQGKAVPEGQFLIQYPVKVVNLLAFRLLRNEKSFARRFLRKLKLDRDLYSKFFLKFYSIYGVAGGIYHKDYFLHIWEASAGLDEFLQIEKSLEYYKINAQKIRIGRPREEMVKTSFASSATNEFKDLDFSIYNFNHRINEAWYSGALSTEDFVPEISYAKVAEILGNDQADQWVEWKNKFSAFYKKIGCITD